MKARNCWLCGLAALLVLATGTAILLPGRMERGKARSRAAAVTQLDWAAGAIRPYAGPYASAEELRSAVRGANVVICVLDAARYGHFGCHGYPRPTTPNVDRLARESLVFTEHYCQITHTRPSTVSLLTSTYPDTHNVYNWEGGLAPSVLTVESVLGAAGWHTAFFSANVHASAAMGVGTGFDYQPGGRPGAGRGRWGGQAPEGRWRPTSEKLLQRVSKWLDSGPPQPFFAYLHVRHPHIPYDAPQEMLALFAGGTEPNGQTAQGQASRAAQGSSADGDDGETPDERDLYDANLRYADWAVGELERLLRQHGVFDDTLLIITSDHGETLGEHGKRKRQWCPYDEVMHIPLIVRFPGRAGLAGSIGALTQTVDLVPTLLDLLDVPQERGGLQGRSLLPLLTGRNDTVNDYAFARTDRGITNEPASYVLRDLRWVLVLGQDGTHRELYDIQADPGQTQDVTAEHPEQVQQMLRAFRSFAEAQARPPLEFVDPGYAPPPGPPGPSIELTDEMRRQLHALGYLD